MFCPTLTVCAFVDDGCLASSSPPCARIAAPALLSLMALLRVTERLWTRDKVQRQALEISDTGGKVLDALSAFLADFDGVGKKLEEAGKAFAQARNRLTDSPQSLSNRARRLVELGSKARKALPAELQPEETLRSVARDDDEEPA